MSRLSLEQKLAPQHTALIVIDVQNDFLSADGLLAKKGRDLTGTDEAIERLELFINVADEANVLVLFTQQIYDRDYLNELQKEQYDFDGKLVTCDIQTEGYKFYKINPPIDKVFVKYNFNIFSNTKLLETLEANGIKTLIITGTDDCYCVETAIRNGFDLGYKIVAAEDLIMGNKKNIDLREAMIKIANKLGVVSSSKEIMSVWRGKY